MIEHLHVWVAITAPFRAVSLCHCFKCEHLGVMHTYVVRHVNNQKMGFGCECTPLIPTSDQLCMYAHNWYMSLCGSLFGVGVGLTKATIRYEQFAKYIINTSSVCRWRKENLQVWATRVKVTQSPVVCSLRLPARGKRARNLVWEFSLKVEPQNPTQIKSRCLCTGIYFWWTFNRWK